MAVVTSAPDVEVALPASRRDSIGVAARLAPIVFLVVMGWTHRWVEEDAFLDFRIVDQIRAGHGPVFNIGQRVEVATSPLWLAMLTAARSVFVFVKIEYVSIVGGLVLTGLGLWWAQQGAARLWGRDRQGRTRVVPVGAVVFAAIPAAWEWATSGLENGLSIAWLGALMLVLATFGRRDAEPISTVRTVGAGALLGLGPLVRPDLAVMSAVALVAFCWLRRPRGAPLAWLLVGFFTLPVLSEIFRAGYYGTLVPNTALAKDAGGTYWSQGWNYLVDLVAPYWLWVPLVVLAVVAVMLLRAHGAPSAVLVLALPIAGMLHALFIVKSGGDYLHARLLLPSLFALLAPFAALPWSRKLVTPAVVLGVWAVVAITALRPSIHQAYVPLTQYDVADGRALMSRLTLPGHRPVLATDFIFTDGPTARRLQEQHANALITVIVKHPLLHATPARTTLVSQASGISGYRAGPDVIVHERNSLADPVGSRMPPNPHSTAGHRKRESYEWVFAMRTRPGVRDGLDARQITAARNALRCGALAELRAATEAPLTVGRFWSNLTGSIGRTRFEVPRDPVAAERKFCGRR